MRKRNGQQIAGGKNPGDFFSHGSHRPKKRERREKGAKRVNLLKGEVAISLAFHILGGERRKKEEGPFMTGVSHCDFFWFLSFDFLASF